MNPRPFKLAVIAALTSMTAVVFFYSFRPLVGEPFRDSVDRVANWQMAHMPKSPHEDSEETGWMQATFYIGLAKWAAISNEERYKEAIRAMGYRNDWKLGKRIFHADDQAIGQVYAAAFDQFRDVRFIKPMTAQFDRILTDKPNVALAMDDAYRCQIRWCWSDALFMAPPAWMALSRITGDPRYRDYANDEYWAAKNYLFDESEHLFFRDSRFFPKHGSCRKTIFWGRGNGWIFAGLVNILHELPAEYPDRARYATLFTEMSERLLYLQRSDGFWSSFLTDPTKISSAESSATALFVYGFASGIELGLLDRTRFEKATLRGWKALLGAVNDQGRLGRVQPIGDRPGEVQDGDSQPYGSGAFLLAGTGIWSMRLALGNAANKVSH